MPNAYEKRMIRVVEYIYQNPAGDLSLDKLDKLDKLAEVAAMSRFHWHRVFVAMTGETCGQATRRIRLHKAAIMLVQTDMQIAKIAGKCGYASAQSFTRTFSDAYGTSPGQFRKRGDFAAPLFRTKTGEYPMFPIEIQTSDTRRLAALAHTGPYAEIGSRFQQMAAIISARNLWPHTRGLVGIYYDDPSIVDAKDLKSHAGVLVADGFEIPENLEEVVLAAGRMAVMHFKGPYSGLTAAYDYLYGKWLAEAGEELRNAPSFEVYLNDPMEVKPDDLLTDIYIPIA